MTNEDRKIQRKLRVLQHAEKIGNVRKACRRGQHRLQSDHIVLWPYPGLNLIFAVGRG